jgi:hypothetical protein
MITASELPLGHSYRVYQITDESQTDGVLSAYAKKYDSHGEIIYYIVRSGKGIYIYIDVTTDKLVV